MAKTNKRVAALVIVLILGLLSLVAAPMAAHGEEMTFSVPAKAAFAVDADTGKVLYDQNGETPMGIASVTKIISMYVVLDQIKSGKLAWEDKVAISDYAEKLSTTPDLSNVPLHKESEYTVKELFDASVIQSANAAVVALAEKISGSEEAFVGLMRDQLKHWGIKDATVINASGLNNHYLGEHRYPGTGENDENQLSARDVAIVARHLITDFPDFLKVSSTTNELFGEHTPSPVEMVNWNWMLPGFVNYKEGVDGLKTGTTDFAGACFVGTIAKNGQRLITVVLNADNHDTDPSSRFTATAGLMDYCFDTWSVKELSTDHSALAKMHSIGVRDGKEETVPVAAQGTVKLWVRNDMDEKQLTLLPHLATSKLVDKQVQAPASSGTVVGHAAVSLSQDTLGYLDDAKQPQAEIVTTKTVEKANFLVIGWRGFLHFIGDIF